MSKKQWDVNIVEYGEEAPEQLLASPHNPRRHDRYQQEIMQELLEEVGVVQDVLVNRRTGHLVDGHMRVMIAMRQGQPTIPVKYVDLTPEQEKVAIATLDAITGLAEASDTAFEELMESIETGSEVLFDYVESLREHGGEPPEDVVNGGDNSTLRALPRIKWGRNWAQMSPDDLESLNIRIEEYENEHGNLAGFVTHLLKDKTL